MLIRHRRPGFVLAETLVAMTIGGIALAIVTAIAVRQQRTLSDLADYAAVTQQLQDARAILSPELRAISPPQADIRDARDSAIEFRATIAVAIVCDTSANVIILPPVSASDTTFADISQSLQPGDSAWILSPNDSAERWTPARITNVSTPPAGACAPLGPTLDAAQRTQPRTALALAPPRPDAVGMPVRITRPVRYSLYHASDNQWYLGQRSWNDTGSYFNTIQPVAGPFLPTAQHGLRFTYLDSNGAAIPGPVVDPLSITTIRVDLRAQTRNPRRMLGAATDVSRHTDSAAAIVALRNR